MRFLLLFSSNGSYLQAQHVRDLAMPKKYIVTFDPIS